MPHVAPPLLVAAPTQQPHRFGLFSASTMVPVDQSPHWQAGVMFEPGSCWPAEGVSTACFDPRDLPAGWPLDPDPTGVATDVSLPFAVYGWYHCSAFGRPVSEAVDRARAHLASGEQTAVERAIAVGDLDNQPSLADAVDLGGPYTLQVAVGMLEGHLGLNGAALGTIHIPRTFLASAYGVVSREGQRLETKLGNSVVAGAGYDLAGLGLDGQGRGPVTLWATGTPQVRRSDVFVHPDPEFMPQTTNNDLTVFAWRSYVVSWSCATAKVTVDVPCPEPCGNVKEPPVVLRQLTLGTTGGGDGTVEADPPSGDGLYTDGTVVTLTAVPAEGNTFYGWADDIPEGQESENPTDVTMDRDRTITAMIAPT